MNTYIKQAKDFLAKTKTTLKIELSKEQKKPLWAKDGKHGLHYICTLENDDAKYTFDFWDSIRDREILEAIDKIKGFGYDSERIQAKRFLDNAGINWEGFKFNQAKKEEAKKEYMPNEYDVLACLSPLYEDNFEDFCSSFGYDSDSITALKTFEACKEQDRNIRKLWDRLEIEKLEAIQ